MVFSNRRINLMGATLAVGLTLFSGLAFAAEQRSANDIINALKPRVSRGLTTSPADAARVALPQGFGETGLLIVVLALVKPLSPPGDLSGQLICGPIEA